MQRTWAAWLTMWCWFVFAFGVLLVTAAIPALDGPARAMFDLFNNNPGSAEAFDQPAVRFGLGLQGALSMGWALTTFAVFRAARTLGAPIWRAQTVALLVWYLTDSAISVGTGFPLNALSNTLLFAGYLAPVLLSGALTRTQSPI